MGNTRKIHPPTLKYQAARDADSGRYTLAELASKYGVHPSEISRWKKILAEGGPKLFTRNPDKADRSNERLIHEQQALIGKMAMQLEEVKKKLGF
jgi:transposase-like protein